MSNFELVLLLSPDLNKSLIDSELTDISKKITDKKGKIVNQEDWGLRDLSYSIKKFNKAFYKFIQIEIDGNHIAILKNDFNQSDNMLRYLFIKVDKHQELPTKLNNEKKS